MKVSRNYTIDYDIARELEDVDNASSLVNQLLMEYFAKPQDTNSEFNKAKEARIIKETQEKMARAEYDDRVKAVLENVQNSKELMDEYKQGIKDKRWKGMVEFAKTKLT